MNRVAFTVDVEQDAPPYFSTWRGLEEGLPLLLSLLDAHSLPATLFVTGQSALRFPSIIATAAEHHEIGCHGFDHARFDRLSPGQQRWQVTEATTVLQRVTGRKPAGFRAPNFQLSRDTLEIIRDAGYLYDASRALYHHGPLRPALELARVSNTFPSSVLRLPARVSLPLLRSAAAVLPLVVLDFHPWELVPMTGVRPDIAFATGETALARLDHVLARLRSSGSQFVTLSEAVLDTQRK